LGVRRLHFDTTAFTIAWMRREPAPHLIRLHCLGWRGAGIQPVLDLDQRVARQLRPDHSVMTGLQESTNRPAKHSTYFCVKWQELYGRIKATPFMRSLDLNARLDDDCWTCRLGGRLIAGVVLGA
jgi:hypothetical protein